MTPDELILVVDDDPEARAMLSAALTEAGFVAVSAADGAGALALVETLAPSLIVLDAVMDGLSGFETCRRLKAQPDHAWLPVIFITGLTETEHVVEGLRAGGVDYVTKPVVLEELIARIRVHLATARLAQSAHRALDAAGRALFAVDAATTGMLWRTPQAAELLSAAFPGLSSEPRALPAKLAEPVRAMIARPPEPGATPAGLQAEGRRLELTCLGRTGTEVYFRLSESVLGREADLLRPALHLTQREAEVLVWIARGKPNRDISEILNISPRTVNKHLEQVFAKLGVENRAAAAAVATRIVAART
jgi:DNA-binding NarL/FixJ family response regulator